MQKETYFPNFEESPTYTITSEKLERLKQNLEQSRRKAAIKKHPKVLSSTNRPKQMAESTHDVIGIKLIYLWFTLILIITFILAIKYFSQKFQSANGRFPSSAVASAPISEFPYVTTIVDLPSSPNGFHFQESTNLPFTSTFGTPNSVTMANLLTLSHQLPSAPPLESPDLPPNYEEAQFDKKMNIEVPPPAYKN